jgi:hypothetical protein
MEFRMDFGMLWRNDNGEDEASIHHLQWIDCRRRSAIHEIAEIVNNSTRMDKMLETQYGSTDFELSRVEWNGSSGKY